MKEKLDFASKIVICAVGALLFGYIALKYALGLTIPFLIAWGMAFAVRAPARFLSSRLRISERLLRLFLALTLGASALLLVFFLVWKLVTEAWRILGSIGVDGRLSGFIERILNPRGALTELMPGGVAEVLANALGGAVERLSASLADFAARFIASLPSVFLFIVITLIAVVYFALDLERVNSFVKEHLQSGLFSALVRFKNGVFSVGIRYARAYFTIMLLTFGICLVGLLLLGVEYALLIAVLICVLDILPVIGIGTVFIPWAVFQLAFGSRALGVGLIVLFLIAEFIRQLAEPKIVGKNLGLHPIVSLILLYGSYSLLGLGGILLIPCAVVVINALLRKDDASEVEKRGVRKSEEA